MTGRDEDAPDDLLDRPDAVRDERRGDRAVLLITTGIMVLVFGAAAALQTIFVYLPERASIADIVNTLPELALRLLANFAAAAVAVVGASLVQLERRGGWIRAGAIVVIAGAAAELRYVVQQLTGIHNGPMWPTVIVENTASFVIVAICLVLGLSQTDARVRQRREERARGRQELRAANALAALASEELKVRREIAEGLHGTVQQQLVLADVQLRNVLDRLRAGGTDPDDLALLERLRTSLDEVRERDVRELSQLLYPVGLNLGITEAIRMVLRRVPPTIATDVSLDPLLAAGEPLAESLGIEHRVTLVRIVEEAVTNALRHGRAGRIAVRLAVEQDASLLDLVIDDDGRGLSAGTEQGSGLRRLAERAERLGGRIELGDSALGGVRLHAELSLHP